jgi:glyoxylase-like metal-dependent hydrolase (beta-lactamase superfamily II)
LWHIGNGKSHDGGAEEVQYNSFWLEYLLNNRTTCPVFILAAVLIVLCLTPREAAASVRKIGPDLYAYISDNDASANSTFLVGDQGILVVDTGLNAEEGRKLLAEIRKVSQAPVRWIVNTHYHPDHRGGNSVVGPDSIIISSEFTRSHAERPAKENSVDETVGPNGLVLYLGEHEVRIYHPGPAHTQGDLVVYFPDEQTIATGDLFLTNSCPAMDDGDMENWIAALDQMLALPVEHVVPGHFELATKSELQRFRNYLADLRDQVARMYQQGMPLAQIQASLRLDAYKNFRQYPNYEATFKDNAAAYYQQLEKRKGPSR